MPCFRPLEAWRSKEIGASGKRGITFSRSNAYQFDAPLKIPCGQCIGCRLERSRQWAIRCMHESTLHDANCFITLTYNDDCLPSDGGLHLDHFQKFMKRLRKRSGNGIRFFHCGEYGEKNGRPHYHACIFNLDFSDKKLWSIQNNNRLYTSEILNELWPFGYCVIGDVTFESAAYVARYIMKKVTGDAASIHYTDWNPETGEVINEKKPEYVTMSRRPGIARLWIDKFTDDVYPHDYVVVNGKKIRPPRYYDRVLETTRPYEFDVVKENREITGKKFTENNTENRLAIREKCQYARLKLLKRSIEE